MAEWTVVEVGAQRDQHPERALRVGDGGGERIEEGVGRCRRRLSEQLLELVYDQQQVRLWVGKHPLHRPLYPGLVVEQLVDQARRRIDRDAEQRRFELLVGVRAGSDVGDEPLSGSGEGAAAEGRQQPGVDHARLAASARSHQGDEPATRAGFAEPRQEPLD